MIVRFTGIKGFAMNPFARAVVTATLSAIPIAVFAADGPPPAEVDLGAMKLKRANAPATTAAAAPAATPAPTGLPAVPRTNIGPAGARQPAPAAAAAPTAPAAAQGTTNTTAQPGIGNVVQTPLKSRATDILQTNKTEEKAAQSNNDLQVKMPSLFRKP
jgi:hypothetical protein